MPKWILEKKFRFEASHMVPHHEGKCRRLHGHSWHGSLSLENNSLHSDGSQTNMVIDFGFISNAIKPLLDKHLDHYHLNDSLEMESPTSEAVAKWIFDRLKTQLPFLVAVTIEETCNCRCTYRGNG